MRSSVVYCFLLLATVLCLSQAELDGECPYAEDSYPCYCEEDEDVTTMHCNHLTESKQFTQALSRLTEYKLSSLSIWMYDVEEIKSDAFKGPAISEIVFSHSTVKIESPPFTGQEKTLNRITFLSCFDEEDFVNSWSFKHLESLKQVSFEKNDIKILQNDWLVSTGPSLRSLTFDNCKIEKLEDRVFSKMTQMTTLFLMENKISILSRSMFPRPAENLRTISINDNNIAFLPDDIFDDMPSLTTVEMERNNLRALSESVWGSKVENLNRIFLEDNPIRCDKELKWISKKILPKIFTGTCSEPVKLKGKSIKHLTPADFH